MTKILIDSDICLDTFTAQYPYSLNADKLLEAVEGGSLTGVVSAESFSNIYYVARKMESHEKAIDLLNNLKEIVVIGTLTPEVVQQALSSGWSDFEDALQPFLCYGGKM